MNPKRKSAIERDVRIPVGRLYLEGELNVPEDAGGIVLFAHGSGSGRHSPRNQYVARTIRESGIGTLLFDLLTREEETEDMYTGHLRFDIGFLAKRLVSATKWTAGEPDLKHLQTGYFGASTGAAAALVAAAELARSVATVVSRGGRPDLAGDFLARVKCPTLLIIGGRDEQVIALNWHAFAQLQCEKELKIVEGATHLFEELGALEDVARIATLWFEKYLQPHARAERASAGE